uniref:NADH-ubiquinone oxidoreductase chain 4L n=1 Tax=Sinopoppia nigroflagella TaxID=2803872 RepID=A0A897G0Y1_9HYME|nr:NADH dehydrogenase subunit 4L [Sinopoppia nigroflagella]QSF20073.1 NADH dehydrogenase subunit 4L [Sinopoppia nigroflagella]
MIFEFDLFDIFYIMFFMGFYSLCINRSHLLMILLSFEFILVLIFMSMVIYLNFFDMEMYFSLIFLVFSVCEGVLGLSVLINMIRMHGNDYIQVLNIL